LARVAKAEGAAHKSKEARRTEAAEHPLRKSLAAQRFGSVTAPGPRFSLCADEHGMSKIRAHDADAFPARARAKRDRRFHSRDKGREHRAGREWVQDAWRRGQPEAIELQ